MNARGRLLTPFENLKAEIQDKASTNNWEAGKLQQKFSPQNRILSGRISCGTNIMSIIL